jgi:hypothetical protein
MAEENGNRSKRPMFGLRIQSLIPNDRWRSCYGSECSLLRQMICRVLFKVGAVTTQETVSIWVITPWNGTKPKQTPWLLVRKRPIPADRPPRPAKLVPTLADSECCVVGATVPRFSRPKPLLFLPRSSSIIPMRLNGSPSKPAISKDNLVVPEIGPGTSGFVVWNSGHYTSEDTEGKLFQCLIPKYGVKQVAQLYKSNAWKSTNYGSKIANLFTNAT